MASLAGCGTTSAIGRAGRGDFSIPDVWATGGWRLPLLLAALVLAAYSPALNNGFISDDYIKLEWVSQWREDFSFIFKLVPDVFRITTYLILGLLKWLFGYHSEFFYAFAILLHTANSVLLWKLLVHATGRPRTAALAAILFAVVQDPQEAVFWLSAITYAIGGFCVLSCLLFWLRRRFIASSLFFLVGLFSSESALMVLLLLPLIELSSAGKFKVHWRHILLLIPTALFLAIFFWTLSSNYMVAPKTYVFAARGALVLAISLHRMMFPWFYLAVLAFAIFQRGRPPREIAGGLFWTTFALLPFVFLTYQNHIPSRHAYVAVMGVVWSLAVLLARLRNSRLRHAFIIMFVAINIGYIWLKKDPQYISRAAPTTQLLQQLRRYPAQRMLIVDFPLNPWIAKMAAGMVAGWQPEMIMVDAGTDGCAECPRLRWNAKLERYEPLGSVR